MPGAVSFPHGRIVESKLSDYPRDTPFVVYCAEPASVAVILRGRGFFTIEDTNFREMKSRLGAAIQGLAPGEAGVHVVHASIGHLSEPEALD